MTLAFHKYFVAQLGGGFVVDVALVFGMQPNGPLVGASRHLRAGYHCVVNLFVCLFVRLFTFCLLRVRCSPSEALYLYQVVLSGANQLGSLLFVGSFFV